MISALQNPNDRRRINKIARIVVKEEMSPAEVVARWIAQKDLPKKERDPIFGRNLGLAQALKAAGKEDGKKGVQDFFAALQPDMSNWTEEKIKAYKKAQKERKAEYARAKAAVAKEFEAQDPEGYKTSTRMVFGHPVKSSYSKRAAGSHASRYYKKSKKALTKPGTGFLKGRKYHVLDVDDVTAWDYRRAMNRWAAAGEQAPSDWQKKKSPAAGWGHGHKTPFAKKAARKNGSALVPMGDLALTNPRISGAKDYLLGYAVPMTVAGGVAGGVHAFASSMGVTAQLSDLTAKVPVVGTFVADNLPFTLQGLIVGSGLALLAPFVGGQAGRYLALTGGTAIVFGGGIDAFNAVSGGAAGEDLDFDLQAELDALESDSVGDLALTNGLGGLALGDLALTNGLGDGMAYEVAPLTMSPDGVADYGQASLADAQYCGADFSGVEGQALLNGRGSFIRRFGVPPHRMSGRTAVGPSHFAGREGHRWGWLVKLVGWERARAIARMSPRQRVRVLQALRASAVKAFQQLQLESDAVNLEAGSAQPELVPAAGSVITGAEGASASNYLGDPALFMGA